MTFIRKSSVLSVTFWALLLAALPCAAQNAVNIYFIDVEGGQATLIVSPTHESFLVDTGYAGLDGRDAKRIADVVKEVGIKKLDYVLITHYHPDHVGGVPALLERVPVGTFLDHGVSREDTEAVRGLYAAYLKAISGSKHQVVSPGDRIRLTGVRFDVVSADGAHIKSPLPGAGEANPDCKAEPTATADATENARSVGVLLTSGKFRFLDLGDLTKQKEIELACPKNMIGTVDVYLTTHHGLERSNAKALVHALHPRVAIMNNGTTKGGEPAAWQIIHDSPGLEDLWQLHRSTAGGAGHNTSDQLIANPDGKCEGKYLKLTASPDGAFAVTNSCTGFTKHYDVQKSAPHP